jgi:hypothetical protein
VVIGETMSGVNHAAIASIGAVPCLRSDRCVCVYVFIDMT